MDDDLGDEDGDLILEWLVLLVSWIVHVVEVDGDVYIEWLDEVELGDLVPLCQTEWGSLLFLFKDPN